MLVKAMIAIMCDYITYNYYSFKVYVSFKCLFCILGIHSLEGQAIPAILFQFDIGSLLVLNKPKVVMVMDLDGCPRIPSSRTGITSITYSVSAYTNQNKNKVWMSLYKNNTGLLCIKGIILDDIIKMEA